MVPLITILRTRLRPRAGWPPALLAIGAALCPWVAAEEASLRLGSGPIFWAGLFGIMFGLGLGRPMVSRWYALLRGSGAGLLLLLIGVALVAAGGTALPPPGLVIGDIAAYVTYLGQLIEAPHSVVPPELLGWKFLKLSLPRLWQALVAAPAAGEAGAALLLTTGAIFATLAGTFVLGWAVSRGRGLLAWSLPLLIALGALTILTGSGGSGLVIGMGLLLTLTLVAEARAREQAWERSGTLYSDEISRELLAWGAGAVAAALMLALSIPTALPAPLAEVVPAPVELPSGIAAIGRHVQRQQVAPRADPGLSQLPAVALGISLEQAAPDQLSLRIHLAAPLPASPWPRYWRARLLTSYNGRAWSANARRSPATLMVTPDAPPGTLAQQVEDLRLRPPTLVGLPDIVALDTPATAELLPEGSLVALTGTPSPRRYQVFSVLQGPAHSTTAPEIPPPPVNLELPPGLPARVTDLAQVVAGEAPTALEQALAIEGYLRALPYAYAVAPLPRGVDAVDQFLFEMRQGYCTYYASAMAVMARSLGIPARLAVGYATGSYDEAGAAYLVYEADAHAWPELYIGGRWLPFEPTPIRPLPQRSGEAALPLPAPVPVIEPQTAPGTGVLFMPWLLLSGAIAAIGAAWLLIRYLHTPLVTRVQLQLERRGTRAGLAWPAGATLREYGFLLQKRISAEPEQLAELITLVEQARYSGHPLNAVQERRLRSLTRSLRMRR